MSDTEVLAMVRAALRSESRIDLHKHPIAIAIAGGVLTMEGELSDIAAKKLALERAAAQRGVSGIVDRLRVAPAQRMGDKEVRDAVVNALLGEPALAACTIVEDVKGEWRRLRQPMEASGEIRVAVDDGVVTLSGEVPGLAHKRLAGLLAWWVPGSRDVTNGLAVQPPEPDSDAEITDAVCLALEKDPFVRAEQIQVGTHNAVVTLRGLVPSAAERLMAEFDAWFVFGVDRVINEIVVRP